MSSFVDKSQYGPISGLADQSDNPETQKTPPTPKTSSLARPLFSISGYIPTEGPKSPLRPLSTLDDLLSLREPDSFASDFRRSGVVFVHVRIRGLLDHSPAVFAQLGLRENTLRAPRAVNFLAFLLMALVETTECPCGR